MLEDRRLLSGGLIRSLLASPQDFWPHFYLGKCAYRLGRYQDSLTQFCVCIALDPDGAESYYNRALVETACRHLDQAMRDYDLALERNSKLASAALNRRILHYQKGHSPKAAADLRRALENGADPAVTLYNLALVQLEQGDRHAALISVQQALRHNADHKEAAELRDRLQRK
jgi:tetratricopeptide (TPR) repeat protein